MQHRSASTAADRWAGAYYISPPVAKLHGADAPTGTLACLRQGEPLLRQSPLVGHTCRSQHSWPCPCYWEARASVLALSLYTRCKGEHGTANLAAAIADCPAQAPLPAKLSPLPSLIPTLKHLSSFRGCEGTTLSLPKSRNQRLLCLCWVPAADGPGRAIQQSTNAAPLMFCFSARQRCRGCGGGARACRTACCSGCSACARCCSCSRWAGAASPSAQPRTRRWPRALACSSRSHLPRPRPRWPAAPQARATQRQVPKGPMQAPNRQVRYLRSDAAARVLLPCLNL